MKRALVVANLAGFASFLFNDIDYLQAAGYQVFFAANAQKLPWEDTKRLLTERNVRFVQIHFDSKKPLSLANIKACFQLCKLMNDNKFDLIHCHTPIAGLLTRIAAIKSRIRGAKVIYTSHGLSYTADSSFKERFLYRTIEDMCSYFTDAIITINHDDYLEVQKYHCANTYYIPGVGVNVHDYIDIDIDRQKYRRSLGVRDNEIMLLSVGELSCRKNHRIIIEALSEINNGQEYVYVICGNGIEGGTGQELLTLAREKNVRVLLLGFRTDIPQITKCSDIGAIPSIREGLGLSGIQSLAAGVPLVGSRVQGIKDYIIDGETGYLCNARDPKSFENAILQLTDDVDCQRILPESCRRMAALFDVSVAKAKMQEIYENVL